MSSWGFTSMIHSTKTALTPLPTPHITPTLSHTTHTAHTAHTARDLPHHGPSQKLATSDAPFSPTTEHLLVLLPPSCFSETLDIERPIILEGVPLPSARHGKKIRDVTIEYRTFSKSNKPAIHINGVRVEMRAIKVIHDCLGKDIWNGNTAVQVEGVMSHLVMRSCDVTGRSGRGIVASRGAAMSVVDTCVHDSAATGVYVGGNGSQVGICRHDCSTFRIMFIVHTSPGQAHFVPYSIQDLNDQYAPCPYRPTQPSTRRGPCCGARSSATEAAGVRLRAVTAASLSIARGS